MILVNERHESASNYPNELRTAISLEGHRVATSEIASWPGYAPTRLRSLGGLADSCGVEEVWVKDEAHRFGLGSFKALGGAYALSRLVADAAEDLTVTCATAGNHGRSVAWGARRFGCRCLLYLPASASASRASALETLGAELIRVRGTYDDAVAQCAADAARNGWQVISDTAYAGYDVIPRDVMQGYTLLVAEALEQLPAGDHLPTHVFVQAGVGGLAAAVCAHLWETFGADRPRIVVVEPEHAACLYASAVAGELTAVDGPLDTAMSCLACARPSTLAWRILEHGADAFMTVDDATALRAVALLSRHGIGSAPSGAAGLAGFLVAASNAEDRAALGLDGRPRILLVNSEGVT